MYEEFWEKHAENINKKMNRIMRVKNENSTL